MWARILRFALGHPLEILLGLAVGLIAIQRIQLARAHAHERALGFEKLNLEATLEGTRSLLGDTLRRVQAAVGESVAVYQRQAVQERQEKDALTRALGISRAASAVLTVRIHDLEVKNQSGTPVVVDANDVRRSTFQIDTIPPYHVTAKVALPKQGPGIMEQLGIQIGRAHV